MRALPGVLVVAAAVGSCSEGRPRTGELANPVSWEEEIGPLFAGSCNSCHSGAAPSGDYRTTSYLDALGPYAAPVATAGDPNSPLLTTIDPAHADAVHQPVSSAFAQTHAWVVDGKLSFFRSETHEGGILNPHDPQFHSNLVRQDGWSFARCQSCHGDPDLSGGKAGVSCQECHSFQVPSGGTPTCYSCHGGAQSPAPPRDLAGNTSPSALGVGAHQAHVLGKAIISAPVACESCHQVPAEVGSANHLYLPDGSLDPLPAEVIFSATAVADGAKPVWDRNAASCSATYCHGGGAKLSGDTKAALRTPVWTATSQVFCGSCHGVPPTIGPHSGVVFPNCTGCHPRTVDAFGNIIVSGSGSARTSFHINGVIDVGP
jgi:predicted CxxxxCH...CXXCH cytochrome family protein